jgi:pimeloyl-ACP methyl ester carboxylesterase
MGIEEPSVLQQVGSYLVWPATFVVGAAGVVLVLLYNFQDKILYYPAIPGLPVSTDDNPDGYKNPGERRVPYEDVMIETADGEKIHSWLMCQEQNSGKVPTLIYFHGNAGNMGFRLENSSKMYFKTGINILTMDYRGYGKSTGTPTEEGLNLDADAVLAWALQHPKLQGSPIVLFGRSLGGAVAVSLAHRNPDKISAIVVENTFMSISAMVDVLMPAVAFAKNLVLRIGWDSLALIQELKCSILFISGDSDELVPPIHMKELYDRATGAVFKDFYSVSGGTHNDSYIVAGLAYYDRLKDFLFRDEITKGLCFAADNAGETGSKGEEQEFERAAIPTMQKDFSVK